MGRTLRHLQRSQPMVQGSFYYLRRKCGNPRCHCAQGQLHGAWVITRKQAGKDRLFTVPVEHRAQLRQLTAEYRRCQKGRAILVKRQAILLELIDQFTQARLIDWPNQALRQNHGSGHH